MQRYHLIRDAMHPDPAGQWVRAEEAEELERRLAMAIAFALPDGNRLLRTPDGYWVLIDNLGTPIQHRGLGKLSQFGTPGQALDAALAAEEKPDGR